MDVEASVSKPEKVDSNTTNTFSFVFEVDASAPAEAGAASSAGQRPADAQHSTARRLKRVLPTCEEEALRAWACQQDAAQHWGAKQ